MFVKDSLKKEVILFKSDFLKNKSFLKLWFERFKKMITWIILLSIIPKDNTPAAPIIPNEGITNGDIISWIRTGIVSILAIIWGLPVPTKNIKIEDEVDENKIPIRRMRNGNTIGRNASP